MNFKNSRIHNVLFCLVHLNCVRQYFWSDQPKITENKMDEDGYWQQISILEFKFKKSFLSWIQDFLSVVILPVLIIASFSPFSFCYLIILFYIDLMGSPLFN